MSFADKLYNALASRLTHDVKLPRHVAPEFPAACVYCKAKNPDSQLACSARSIGWWSWLGVYGRKVSVNAPACAACARKERWRRRIDGALYLLVAIAAIALMFYWFNPKRTLLTRWPMLLGAVALTMPYLFIKKPPRFDMTVYADAIDYEFTDLEYATAFAQLNDGSLDIAGDAEFEAAAQAPSVADRLQRHIDAKRRSRKED